MARHQRKRRAKREARPARQAASHAASMVSETSEHVREAGARMSHEAGNTGRRMNEAAQQGARQFSVMGERAFEAWVRTSNEALRRVLEMNVELASWSREQMDDSINAVRSLAQCRSMGDAYGVQLGLMRSSMEKSVRHASNVLNLAAHAMVDGARVAQQGVAGRSAEGRFAQAD